MTCAADLARKIGEDVRVEVLHVPREKRRWWSFCLTDGSLAAQILHEAPVQVMCKSINYRYIMPRAACFRMSQMQVVGRCETPSSSCATRCYPLLSLPNEDA